MHTRHVMARVLLVSVGAGLCGCPTAPSAGGGGGLIGDVEFTAARQAAVAAIVGEVTRLAETLAALLPLADARVEQIGGFGSFGSCPRVDVLRSAIGTNVSFDYGGGCRSLVTGPSSFAGAASVDIPADERLAQARVTGILIDGVPRGGFVTGSVETVDDGVILAGQATLRTSASGRADGELAVGYERVGALRIAADALRVQVAGRTYIVTLDNLRSDPANNITFLPESGALRFRDERLVELTVQFSRRTRETGDVQVIVGNGSPVLFTP